MKRNGFVFYSSYWDVASDMNDTQFKEFVSAMCRYYFDGEETTFSDPLIEKLFLLVKPNIDTNIKKQEAGAKGGRPPKNNTDGFETEKPMVLTNGFNDDKPLVSIDKDKDKEVDKDKDIFSAVPAEIKTALTEYQDWRLSKGKGYGSKNAVQRAVNRLQELAPDDYQKQIAIIYQALDGGYFRFVPLVDNAVANSKKQSSRLGFLDDFAKGGC